MVLQFECQHYTCLMGAQMSEKILKNCTIYNYDKIIKRSDIFIKDNKIMKIAPASNRTKGIDLNNCIVLPGLIDMHVHFREPGEEHKEDIKTGIDAAIKGGFTGICTMPNTSPPIDNPQSITYIKTIGKNINKCDIMPFGSLTKNLEGKEITEMYDMIKAGAIGFSDDGEGTSNSLILMNAMKYISESNTIISTHCEDKFLTEGGQINESVISLETGLKGMPYIEETISVFKTLSLAEYLKTNVHIAHISLSKTLDIIRSFKKNNSGITCEVTPHHLIFNETIHKTFNTIFKVKPPLRTATDNNALLKGIVNGYIDVIATDHAPHQIYEKEVEFNAAPFGMIGLETALISLYSYFIKSNKMNFTHIAKTMSYNPSKILNTDERYIKAGNIANITVFNPLIKSKINHSFIRSKSQNNPFLNKTLDGGMEMTIYRGKIVYKRKK